METRFVRVTREAIRPGLPTYSHSRHLEAPGSQLCSEHSPALMFTATLWVVMIILIPIYRPEGEVQRILMFA